MRRRAMIIRERKDAAVTAAEVYRLPPPP